MNQAEYINETRQSHDSCSSTRCGTSSTTSVTSVTSQNKIHTPTFHIPPVLLADRPVFILGDSMLSRFLHQEPALGIHTSTSLFSRPPEISLVLQNNVNTSHLGQMCLPNTTAPLALPAPCSMENVVETLASSSQDKPPALKEPILDGSEEKETIPQESPEVLVIPDSPCATLTDKDVEDVCSDDVVDHAEEERISKVGHGESILNALASSILSISHRHNDPSTLNPSSFELFKPKVLEHAKLQLTFPTQLEPRPLELPKQLSNNQCISFTAEREQLLEDSDDELELPVPVKDASLNSVISIDPAKPHPGTQSATDTEYTKEMLTSGMVVVQEQPSSVQPQASNAVISSDSARQHFCLSAREQSTSGQAKCSVVQGKALSLQVAPLDGLDMREIAIDYECLVTQRQRMEPVLELTTSSGSEEKNTSVTKQPTAAGEQTQESVIENDSCMHQELDSIEAANGIKHSTVHSNDPDGTEQPGTRQGNRGITQHEEEQCQEPLAKRPKFESEQFNFKGNTLLQNPAKQTCASSHPTQAAQEQNKNQEIITLSNITAQTATHSSICPQIAIHSSISPQIAIHSSICPQTATHSGITQQATTFTSISPKMTPHTGITPQAALPDLACPQEPMEYADDGLDTVNQALPTECAREHALIPNLPRCADHHEDGSDRGDDGTSGDGQALQKSPVVAMEPVSIATYPMNEPQLSAGEAITDTNQTTLDSVLECEQVVPGEMFLNASLSSLYSEEHKHKAIKESDSDGVLSLEDMEMDNSSLLEYALDALQSRKNKTTQTAQQTRGLGFCDEERTNLSGSHTQQTCFSFNKGPVSELCPTTRLNLSKPRLRLGLSRRARNNPRK